MIGLDTNALLRWLAADALSAEDAAQASVIDRVVAASSAPIYVNAVVLVESAWVLRSRFGQSRPALADTLRALLAAPHVEIEHRPAVSAALERFEAGGPGFADHFIAEINRAAGCATTLTFDRGAARAPGFTPI